MSVERAPAAWPAERGRCGSSVKLPQRARLTPIERLTDVDRLAASESVTAIADALGVLLQTLYKRQRRVPADLTAAHDRRSTPHTSPTRLRRTRRRQISRQREQRSERAVLGELVPFDLEKLGKIGRVAHRIRSDRRRHQCGIAWFAEHGITTERQLTDNGSAHRSLAFATARLERSTSQRFTRVYRP